MSILKVTMSSSMRTSIIIASQLRQKCFQSASTSPFICLRCNALPYSTKSKREQKYPSYFNKKPERNKKLIWVIGIFIFYCCAAGGTLSYLNYRRIQAVENEKLVEKKSRSKVRRVYTAADVEKHPNWTIYKGSVYDFGNYKHPGGEEMLKKAGGASLEPYWDKYPFHNDPEILKELKSLKIGDLITDAEAVRCKSIRKVPKANLANWRLILSFGTDQDTLLTMKDIMDFPKYSIVSSIPCKSDPKQVEAESAPTWSGTRFIDIVNELDVDLDEYDHVQFECMDCDKEGVKYRVSISSMKVKNPNFKILLAYEMNGEDIPLEHGYPIRVVIPDLPGGRNVKWIQRIIFKKNSKFSPLKTE